ncbi:MAG: ATP-binding protein, partial [Polyangiaceae bacterium]|nr:ATP-binding protein [Polyangiaceae bacterium]
MVEFVQPVAEWVRSANAVELVGEEHFAHLLDGFARRLRMPLSLYYSISSPATSISLRRITADPAEPPAGGSSQPVCTVMCGPGVGTRGVCRAFDESCALRYYARDWAEPRVFRCHLQLWGMTQPIVVDDDGPVVLGVLGGGRLILREPRQEWYAPLKEWADAPDPHGRTIDWDSIAEKHGCQVEAIRHAVGRIDLDESTRTGLLQAITNARLTTTEDLCDCFERFVDFGAVLRELMGNLFQSKKASVMRQRVAQAKEDLMNADLTDEDGWWATCGDMCQKLGREIGLQEVRVYSRKRRFFFRVVPAANKRRGGAEARIAAKYVLPAVPHREMVDAFSSPERRDLATRLGLPQEASRFFVHQTKAGDCRLATLIALVGQVPPSYGDFAESLCKLVGQRGNFAAQVFRQAEAETAHRLEVTRVAHDFRTPLQVAVFDIDETLQLPAVKADPVLSRLLTRSRLRILAAADHTRRLQGMITSVRRRIDLGDFLAEIMEDLGPVADNHPCVLERRPEWESGLVVHANEYDLRGALVNLIENAIKYSFQQRTIDGMRRPYQVRVGLQRTRDGYARVTISNYGIGIPPDKIKEINEPGVRARVHDRRCDRAGTGWGLPI